MKPARPQHHRLFSLAGVQTDPLRGAKATACSTTGAGMWTRRSRRRTLQPAWSRRDKTDSSWTAMPVRARTRSAPSWIRSTSPSVKNNKKPALRPSRPIPDIVPYLFQVKVAPRPITVQLIVPALAGQPMTKEHGPPRRQKDLAEIVLAWLCSEGCRHREARPAWVTISVLGKGHVTSPAPLQRPRHRLVAGERVDSQLRLVRVYIVIPHRGSDKMIGADQHTIAGLGQTVAAVANLKNGMWPGHRPE